ncbi:MAG: GntR family transcriptional regulator [Acuticoccus sp.]
MTDTAAGSAQAQAYEHIRREIQSGRLAGGARVKPEDVAGVLGISRMPVREAIRQLDTEGFLTIRPNRGAVVTVLSQERLEELFEMRAVLEGLCARWAARRFDEDAFDELTLLLNRMNRATDSDQWIERHEAFHEYICAGSGRPMVAEEVRRLRAAVEPYLRIAGHKVALGELAAAQHGELIAVLRTGDGAKAEAAMRHHVDSTIGDFLAAIADTDAT